MIDFLKLVGAVLIVVVGLIVLAWYVIMRWVRRQAGHFVEAGKLAEGLWARPARIHLRSNDDFEPDEPLQTLWEQLTAARFRRVGDYFDENGGVGGVRLALHRDQPIAAVLAEEVDRCALTLFAIDTEKRVYALSFEEDSPLTLDHLAWEFAGEHRLDHGLSRLRERLGDRRLIDLKPRQVARAWEQLHAFRAERALQHPPRRGELETRAAKAGLPEDQVETAYELLRSHWLEQLSDAVLHRFRREQPMDSVAWEELEADVQVVHDRLTVDEVEELLAETDADRILVDQARQRDLAGMAAYEYVESRLPADRRRQLLGTVNRPVPARIYAVDPDAEVEPDGGTQFGYRALDPDGKVTHGVVIARDAGDAKRQVAARGCSEVVILTEQVLESDPLLVDGLGLDEQALAAGQEGLDHGIGWSLFMSLRNQWWVWLPPLALLAWSIYEGRPFGWGDYVIFGYAALALTGMVLILAPMALFDAQQHARVSGRWGTALTLTRILRRFPSLGVIPAWWGDLEEATILAGRGDYDAAKALWESIAGDLDEAVYWQGVAQLCDEAGDLERKISAHRRHLKLKPGDAMLSLDLAMSLAHTAEGAPEARQLLAGLDAEELPELGRVVFDYSHGLLALETGDPADALPLFQQALGRLHQNYRGVPLMRSVVLEIEAMSAIALGRLGRNDQATELWDRVWPQLAVHPSSAHLRERFDGAAKPC